MYTVKQVGKMSGVSIRTLHHYHAAGLLVPAHIGRNQYRYYGEKELLRLQQILFYKRFGFSLAEIAKVLGQKDFDHLTALQDHRARLQSGLENTRTLIATIDRTIARLQGHTHMENEHLYEGFSPEKQSEHENWLVKNGEKNMRSHIETAKKHRTKKPAKSHAENMQVLQKLESDMADCMAQGLAIESTQMDTLLDQHRTWVSSQWGRECTPEAYAGLSDMYAAHPDFVARYETIAQGFANYLCTAMKAYGERQCI